MSTTYTYGIAVVMPVSKTWYAKLERQARVENPDFDLVDSLDSHGLGVLSDTESSYATDWHIGLAMPNVGHEGVGQSAIPSREDIDDFHYKVVSAFVEWSQTLDPQTKAVFDKALNDDATAPRAMLSSNFY